MPTQNPTRPKRRGGALAGLRPALDLLDVRLRDALAEAERRFGTEAGADPYRGLYLSPEDVSRSLTRAAGEPAYPPLARTVKDLARATPRLRRLALSLSLSPFETAVVLVAVAPEADLRYERIYAFLQDDVTRKRPSLDLALGLLCRTAGEKERRRRHFTADAPLLSGGVLELAGDPARPDAPLLSLDLVVAGPAAGYLLGSPGPDPRLAPLLADPPDPEALPPLGPRERRALCARVREAASRGRAARLYFRGAPGSGRQRAAADVARGCGSRLLALDLGRTAADDPTFDRLLRRALLEARLRGWVLWASGIEDVGARRGEAAAARTLARLAAHPGTLILGGSGEWTPEEGTLPGVETVPFAASSFRRRRAAWRRALAREGMPGGAALAPVLAERFELTPLQVSGAVRTAVGASASVDDALFAGARAQAGRDMGEQARRVEPVFGFDDLVLPSDGRRQLREICQRVVHRRQVMERWGFGARLTLGSGVNALFSGPSGTGKTMAAQIVAGALGLDLYRIDLSRVVSKYIGETEKNLGRIFDRAESSNAILFFDEADALFGKRSEVKDAHDRYANIETGYLLQKMEEYPGVTILATNLRQNMDEAFVRRLAFHVQFPLPDEADRVRIWERALPPAAPVAPDVDFAFLGRSFRVTGGNIRNTAVAAAFLAAEEGAPVSMRHLVLGMRREFQKMGKVCVETDFGPWFGLLDGDAEAAEALAEGARA